MQRRTKLGLLILVAILLLGLGIYFALQPVREGLFRKPPALPDEVTPTSDTTNKPVKSTQTAPTVPVKSDSRIQVEYRARTVVERMWNGTSQDGFLGFRDAELDATTNGKLVLRALQQELVSAHPPTAPLFEISAKAVAVKILSGKEGDTALRVRVDTLLTMGSAQATTKHVTLGFIRQANGAYLVDTIAIE